MQCKIAKDVIMAYDRLKAAGYEEIAVAGLSLGGVFSLKLGYTVPVKGIVTMCSPMSMKTTDIMFEGVLKYAREYKKYEGKTEEEIENTVGEVLSNHDKTQLRIAETEKYPHVTFFMSGGLHEKEQQLLQPEPKYY